jgi:GNAT superfamily N-acetyltransferase
METTKTPVICSRIIEQVGTEQGSVRIRIMAYIDTRNVGSLIVNKPSQVTLFGIPTFQLEHIQTSPNYRKRGIAKTMMREAILELNAKFAPCELHIVYQYNCASTTDHIGNNKALVCIGRELQKHMIVADAGFKYIVQIHGKTDLTL